MLIHFNQHHLLACIVILGLFLLMQWQQKRSISKLLFTALFGIYLLAAIQTVIFPFAINLNIPSDVFIPSINFMPFYFGTCHVPDSCIRGAIENILLTVPLGFGINFLVYLKPQKIGWLAIGGGIGFEAVQLAISLIFKSSFRAVDINDAILNGLGVCAGYGIFRIFAWIYLKAVAHFDFLRKGILKVVFEIVNQAKVNDS